MTSAVADRAELRTRLGSFGVWIAPATLLSTPIGEQRAQVRRIEDLGYGSFWTGEAPVVSPIRGREIFTQLAVVLAATDRLVTGAGIANITLREPAATHGAAATLAEAYPGRLVLGLGGQTGDRPLAMVRDYLDRMDDAARTLLPDIRYSRVLAALGPKTMGLAATRADGAHPFSQPVAHTVLARQTLGPDPLLIPHQFLLADMPVEQAREVLRMMVAADTRGESSPYTANFRRLGYTDDDLAGRRSDRLIDAILAAGDPDAVAERLREHRAAGADHVLLHPLAPDLSTAVDQLEKLAPRLGVV
ncbi:TIGR03620 family F420-dependent LLM class oxidoreductase [Nocardia sp. NPDC005366]|uniref:TIGR03620 family F420-dependent LLM class oxidoreductase n=1 Tax=Nocardia sp. NPDC005366 TaxID=3156878 RepID=UPI0033B808D1